MASAAIPRAPQVLARLQDLVLPVAIIASVLVILVPLPTALLDVLLAANVAVAVMMLLTTISVRTPLEFSVFPSLLLATTLARLVLNVATTRLILTRAHQDGLLAAGGVVKSFGQFVAGDKLIVGLVIFAIIVVIQFVVITKGTTRISEVAARFALDGLPGRQMAIDADRTAGIIDDAEAQRRRAQLSEQADFYGAMDGASKFVRGDAVAGIVITLVNIIGGLAIGVFDHGMPIGQAASVFTRLTIGDGLVSQVPAFLIALAAGLLVTRSTTSVNLPQQFLTQLLTRPQTLLVTAAFLGCLIFTRLPALPLAALAAGCAALAWTFNRQASAATTKAADPTPAAGTTTATGDKPKPREDRVEDFLAVDPMEVEIGVGLIRLADAQRGGDLLDRIQRVRQSIAGELGLLMPKVRVRDNLRLDARQYRIKVADIPVAEGKLYPGMLLAIDAGTAAGTLAGLATREPAGNRPATWIEPSLKPQAESLGYQVLDPVTALISHLAEVVRGHADELLSRDAAKHLVDQLKQSSPAVVDELIPGQLRLAEVQQVLQLLLREQVSIRPLAQILEALGEQAARTRDPWMLVEHVRRRLTRAISALYRDKERRLVAVTLDPALEDHLRAATQWTPEGAQAVLPPAEVERVCQELAEAFELPALAGRVPVVLASATVRPALRHLVAHRLPRAVVLSYDELTADTLVESAAMVGGTAVSV